MTSRQTIDPPVPQGPVQSLFNTANQRADLNPQDWVDGWQWLPYRCGPGAGGIVDLNCDVYSTALDTDAMSGPPAKAVGDPFVAWDSYVCSTLGRNDTEYRQRAQQALEASQSFKAAGELWTGNEFNGPSLDATTGLDVLTAGQIGVAQGIALLDAGLAASCRRGQIHMTVQTLTLAVAAQVLLRPSGNTWLTPAGNVVVADGGYPGTGPGGTTAAGSSWAYTSSPVVYATTPIEVIDPGDDLVRAENTARYLAHRLVALMWEPCARYGVELGVSPGAFGA